MADDVIIQHPTFTDQYYIVPAEAAAEWEATGWLRVKRADEAKVAGQAIGAPSGSGVVVAPAPVSESPPKS